MMKETYERPQIEVSIFDAVDVILTSGEPKFNPQNPWEMPIKP